MKTDKFEENIRQKLEGIDPPFRENDWLHLRSFLRRNGVPSIGGTATQWIAPMLSAATVAGLVVLTVWQYRTNQKLEQTVRSLKDTVTILQQAPLEAPVAEAPKTDTVYITREVPVPQAMPSAPKYQDDDRGLAERSETDRPDADPTNDDSPTSTESAPLQKRERYRPEGNGVSERAESSERLTKAEKGVTESNLPNTGREFSERTERNSNLPNSSKPANDRWNRTNERYSGSSRQKSPGFETTRPLSTGTSGQTNQSGTLAPAANSAASPSISWEPVQNRPLQFDSSYYVDNYQRRVRRIRPMVTQSATASTLKPVVERDEPFVRFRIGGSAQIGGRQSGFGFASEILMGDRLTIGVGLNRLKVAGEQYLNEAQYGFKRGSNFRRDYPGKVPPEVRTEVVDINRNGATLQLPVTFGYRIPLGNSVTLTPAIGASFSLEARDKVSYMHQIGPFDFIQKKFSEKCAPSVYNSWLVNIAVEKQWNHWVIQASPYISNPLLTTQFSLNHTSAGMRARLLYQF